MKISLGVICTPSPHCETDFQQWAITVESIFKGTKPERPPSPKDGEPATASAHSELKTA